MLAVDHHSFIFALLDCEPICGSILIFSAPPTGYTSNESTQLVGSHGFAFQQPNGSGLQYRAMLLQYSMSPL